MKEWFIFKGGHHIGPFSKEELADFYKKGSLSSTSLVWKEGQEKWMSFSKISELNLSQLPNLPDLPDLPSLPDLPKLPEDRPSINKSSAVARNTEALDVPPPLPLDVFKINLDGPVKLTTSENIQDELPLNSFANTNKIPPKKFQFQLQSVLILSIGIIFLSFFGWYFWNEWGNGTQLRIKGLMPGHLEKLQEVAENKSPFFEMTMALSHDGTKFFVATNKGGAIDSNIDKQFKKAKFP